MVNNLLLPAMLLFVVLVGALILLRVDAQQRRLGNRVADVTGGERLTASEQEQIRGLRMATHRRGRLLTMLIKLLRVPVDLEHALVVPRWVVFVAGIGVAIGAYVICRLYFARWTAFGEAILTSLVLVRGVFSWETRRYAMLLTRQLPDVIELVSSTVMAGLPASEGLRNVAHEMPAPTRDEFARVVHEIGLGMTPDTALMNLHDRTGVVEYAILAVTLGVQTRSGGRLLETVQTLAETIRQRLAVVARGNALSAEAKLSAYIMVAMPVFGGVVLSLIRPGYLYPLFLDPRGNKMLMISIGLVIAGSYIMHRMIRGALSE